MIKYITTTKTVALALLLILQINAMAQTKRLPANRTEEEKLLMLLEQKNNKTVYGKTGGFVLPANIRFPGEFEESQAVAISWSDGFDPNTGNPTGHVDTISEWGYVSAQLCDNIQEEAQIWIRVPTAIDTTYVKNFMIGRGKPLYNYRFFITTGDSWWMRDFGPNGIYYGSKDSIAFIDLKYYSGRDLDDKFPVYLANQLGYQNFESTVNGEGGNLMEDGFGRVFFSSMLTDENASSGTHTPDWSTQQFYDSLSYLFNCPRTTQTKSLQCDGGTGHIDLYLKMIDEQTIMVSQYPKAMTTQDRKIIEDNCQMLTTLKSTYNRPFRIFRIMHPTGDNGTYVDTSCTKVNADARTFVNGLTVNKMFVYPSYSDGSTGNQAQTDSATNLFKYIMPGYKIRPIDSRSVSPYAGELHCITMQIPAENPVLFWHPSIDGLKPFGTQFHLLAKITNNSGIQTAICKWRKRGAITWNTINLTDSSGYFIGDIVDNTLTVNDKVEYFLSATTVNGKTAVKPITAPDGYYIFYFKTNTGLENLQIVEKDYLFGAYPNPAKDEITIPFYVKSNAKLAFINIYDISGKLIISNTVTPFNGLNKVETNTTNFENGVYYYTYQLDANMISTRKFVIAK